MLSSSWPLLLPDIPHPILTAPRHSPSNAYPSPRARSCYDWGTFGWLLMHSGHVNHKQYRYFFFINSSVRGPFMPPYARVRVRKLLCRMQLCSTTCAAHRSQERSTSGVCTLAYAG